MTWEVPERLVQCLVCKLKECEVLFCNHLAEVITVDANTRNTLHYYRENKKTLATVQLDAIITHHIFLYSLTVRVKYQSDIEIRSSEVQSVRLAYDDQPWIHTDLPWHTSIVKRFAQEKTAVWADYIRNMHSQTHMWMSLLFRVPTPFDQWISI